MKIAIGIWLALACGSPLGAFEPPLQNPDQQPAQRALFYFYGIPDGAKVYYLVPSGPHVEITDRTAGVYHLYTGELPPFIEDVSLFEVVPQPGKPDGTVYRLVHFRAGDTRHILFKEFFPLSRPAHIADLSTFLGHQAPVDSAATRVYVAQLQAGTESKVDVRKLLAVSGPLSFIELPAWITFDGKDSLSLSPQATEVGEHILRGVLASGRAAAVTQSTPFYLRIIVKPGGGNPGGIVAIGRGKVILRLPANAFVTINDIPVSQGGEVREFETAPLRAGEKSQLKIKIDFRNQAGRQIVRTKTVALQSGQTLELTVDDFVETIGE